MKIFSILLISFPILGVFSQEFSGIISAQSCDWDTDCIGSDVCHVRQCRPISELQKCEKSPYGDDCEFEYLCVGGVCRYITDIKLNIHRGPKHSFVPTTCTHPLECPDNRKCVNGQCR